MTIPWRLPPNPQPYLDVLLLRGRLLALLVVRAALLGLQTPGRAAGPE